MNDEERQVRELMKNGRFEEAYQLAEEVCEGKDLLETKHFRCYMATKFIWNGQYDRAQKVIEPLTKIKDSEIDLLGPVDYTNLVVVQAALAYRQEWNRQKALDILKSAEGAWKYRYREGKTEGTPSFDLFDNLVSRIDLETLKYTYDIFEKEEILLSIISRGHESPNPSSQKYAETYYAVASERLANLYASTGRDDKAVEVLTHLVEELPNRDHSVNLFKMAES